MTANTPKTKTCSCLSSLSSCLRGVSNRFSRLFRKSKKKTELNDNYVETGSDLSFDSCDEALIFYDCCDSIPITSVSPGREENAIVQDKTTLTTISSKENENSSKTLGPEKDIESSHLEVDGSTLLNTRCCTEGLVDSCPIPRSALAREECLERLYGSDPTFCRKTKNVRLHGQSYHKTIFGHWSDTDLKKTEISNDCRPADEHESKRSNCSSYAPRSRSSPSICSSEQFQLIRKSHSFEEIGHASFEKDIFEGVQNVKERQNSNRSTSNANLENEQPNLEFDLAVGEEYWKRFNCTESSVCSVSCPTLECSKDVHKVKKVKSENYTKDLRFESEAISTRRKQENEPVTALQLEAKYDETQESRADGIVRKGSSISISTDSLDSEAECLLEFDNHLAAIQISNIEEKNFWTVKENSSSIPSSPETHQGTSPKPCSTESLVSRIPDGESITENITKNSESPVSSSCSTGSGWSSSSECSQVTGSDGVVKKKKAMKVPRFFIRELLSEEARSECFAKFSQAVAQEVPKDGSPLNEVALTDSARPKIEKVNFPPGSRVVLAPPASHPHRRKDRQVYRKAGTMDEISTEENRTTAKNFDEEVRLSRSLPSPVRQHCVMHPADIDVSKSSAKNRRHQAYLWADQFQDDQLSFANFDDAVFSTVTNVRSLVIQELTEPIDKLEDISAHELRNQVNYSQWDLEVTNKYREVVGKRSKSFPMNPTANSTSFCRSYRSLPDFRTERQIETSKSWSGS